MDKLPEKNMPINPNDNGDTPPPPKENRPASLGPAPNSPWWIIWSRPDEETVIRMN